MNDDPFWKLKPVPATPLDQVCNCAVDAPYMLLQRLGPNPIVCMHCKREVPPETSGFTPKQAEAIASWNSLYSCFYLLWLDSAEYETWSQHELEDPESALNARSVSLVQSLSSTHPTYYSWFESPGDEDWEPLSSCPLCKSRLRKHGDYLLCDSCHVVGWAPDAA